MCIYSFNERVIVAIQMWLIIVVGMAAGVAGQLMDVYLGNARWSSAQFSFYFYIVLIIYSSWKLVGELKKRGC